MARALHIVHGEQRTESWLSQRVVLLVGDRLAPLGIGILTGYFLRKVLKPAILGRAVPMLDVGGYTHHVAYR